MVHNFAEDTFLKLATTLLFFKIERNHWPILKAFLVFLQYMPENDLIDVQINHEVMGKLGQI